MRPTSWPLLFAALVLAVGHGPARAVPPAAVHAVVRIPSHGASATVIDTRPGYSLLLGCGHAFEGSARARPIRLDVPAPEVHAPKKVKITLLAVDYQADLSLILLEDGPLAYVAPVAPAGHTPGKHVLSIGYDEMRWSAQQVASTLLTSTATTSYTRERPGPGRSGGALLDAEHGWLIGVVQGYEVVGQRRGLYVAHSVILRFLQRAVPPPAPPVRKKRFDPICPT